MKRVSRQVALARPATNTKSSTTYRELKPVLDDLYESFKRQDQEERIKERINKAVAEEREKWETRLAKER